MMGWRLIFFKRMSFRLMRSLRSRRRIGFTSIKSLSIYSPFLRMGLILSRDHCSISTTFVITPILIKCPKSASRLRRGSPKKHDKGH